MNRICWSNVRLILAREIRDQLRDRRTMFMIAILPLLLYPLMGMSFMQVAQFLKKNPSKVLLVSEEPLPDDPLLIRNGRPVDLPESEAALLIIEYQQQELPETRRAEMQATALIDQGVYDMVVCFPGGLWRRIAMDGAVDGTVDSTDEFGKSPSPADDPIIYYNAAKDRSRIAHQRMTYVLGRWRHKIVAQKLELQQVSQQAVLPFSFVQQDVAKPSGRQAAVWSKLLPFVALIWALTGAFYPAVDLCAGEKERGTLETLLSSPAKRSEIVWGKLLTIMLFSFITSLLNLLCMTFTATFALRQFHGMMGAASLTVLGPPPLAAIGWLVLALIPIVTLFSALALALATLARSSREGQYYLMPLLLTTMPLMLLAMFPSAELDLGSSIIPITGVMLLLRQLMEGEYRTAFTYAVPVIVVTFACSWMAVRWAIDQFNNENVLFRESERFEVGLWIRRLFRDRAPTPSATQAILCGLVILLIRFFAGLSLSMPHNWSSFAVMTILTMIAFVATPALLMAVVMTTQPGKSLLLTRPSKWMAIPAAALLAVGLHPIATGMSVVVRVLYPIDATLLEPFNNLFAQAPSLGSMILLLAVFPAICEELAFRGFILSGLRHLGHRWRAIFISSLLFGIAHGVIQQSMMAIMFGMVLGFLAVHTRSILPCIVFHAVHNTLGICSSHWMTAAHGRQLDWLVQSVQDTSGGAMYFYGPPVMLAAFVFCAGLFRWFSEMPYEPSEEERLQEAMEQRNLQAVTS